MNNSQIQTIIKKMNITRRINIMSLTTGGFFKHNINVYNKYERIEKITTKLPQITNNIKHSQR